MQSARKRRWSDSTEDIEFTRADGCQPNHRGERLSHRRAFSFREDAVQGRNRTAIAAARVSKVSSRRERVRAMPDDTRKRKEWYLAERARKIKKVFGGFRERGVSVEIKRSTRDALGVKNTCVQNADVQNADVQAYEDRGWEGKQAKQALVGEDVRVASFPLVRPRQSWHRDEGYHQSARRHGIERTFFGHIGELGHRRHTYDGTNDEMPLRHRRGRAIRHAGLGRGVRGRRSNDSNRRAPRCRRKS